MVLTFVAQVTSSEAMKLSINDGNEFAGSFLIAIRQFS
jgi:hypothetical protein